jgi:hypothetical protein
MTLGGLWDLKKNGFSNDAVTFHVFPISEILSLLRSMLESLWLIFGHPLAPRALGERPRLEPGGVQESVFEMFSDDPQGLRLQTQVGVKFLSMGLLEDCSQTTDWRL